MKAVSGLFGAVTGGSSGTTSSGGSNSSNSTSNQNSASGYSALSPALQAAFNPIGQQIGALTNPGNAGVTDMFSPQGPTAAMTNATNNINAGFAPNAASIGSDMAMQMNPYNDSVINTINQQGQGQYSVLKQAMNAAGQGTDSNRSLLGANDIDLTRQNLIGSFLNGQFNTSMNNALTTLPNARAADAANIMNTGMLNNSVINAQKLAPITALQAGTGMMAPFLQGGTATGTSSSIANGTTASSGNNSSNNGIGGVLGGIGSLAAFL